MQTGIHYRIKAFEIFYVFDGSADFQVGDELFHAKKGSCVHIPPGVPHQVTSQDGVRMLMIYSPAGTEGMFAAMHALSQDQLMNAELTKQIALKYDTVMIEQSKDVAARERFWDNTKPARRKVRSGSIADLVRNDVHVWF